MPDTLLVICDHTGTPKSGKAHRRLARVNTFGLVSDRVPYMDVDYFGAEPEQPSRVDYPVAVVRENPEIVHITYRFVCTQCQRWDVPVNARSLYDIVTGSAAAGVPSLSLAQIAATFDSKR